MLTAVLNIRRHLDISIEDYISIKYARKLHPLGSIVPFDWKLNL